MQSEIPDREMAGDDHMSGTEGARRRAEGTEATKALKVTDKVEQRRDKFWTYQWPLLTIGDAITEAGRLSRRLLQKQSERCWYFGLG